MSFPTLCQLIGGILLTSGYVPQIVQAVQTRSMRDVNLGFIGMVFAGICLYEVYAVSLVLKGTGGAYLATNTVSLICSGVLVWLKIRYRRGRTL